MTELRNRRWRAVIVAEFETRDYPGDPEAATARLQAADLARGADRAEKGVNVTTPPTVELESVGPVDA